MILRRGESRDSDLVAISSTVIVLVEEVYGLLQAGALEEADGGEAGGGQQERCDEGFLWRRESYETHCTRISAMRRARGLELAASCFAVAVSGIRAMRMAARLNAWYVGSQTTSIAFSD